jgi:hypothetical protein
LILCDILLYNLVQNGQFNAPISTSSVVLSINTYRDQITQVIAITWNVTEQVIFLFVIFCYKKKIHVLVQVWTKKCLRFFKIYWTIIFMNALIKVCLHDQIFPSNSIQTWPVHLFQTQIWPPKHQHQILEGSLIGV